MLFFFRLRSSRLRLPRASKKLHIAVNNERAKRKHKAENAERINRVTKVERRENYRKYLSHRHYDGENNRSKTLDRHINE